VFHNKIIVIVALTKTFVKFFANW